jgi:Xaa-Pro dipeptidase
MSLPFPPHLQRIVEAEYPRFSATEMERRRAALAQLLTAHGLDHLVYCGFNRTGSAVQWLAQWPVTAEAVGVFSPGKPDALFVQYFNHVPLAQQLAERAEVSCGGESSIGAAIAALAARGARAGRVGVIGPLPFDQHARLAERFGPLVNLNRPYVRLRMIKSAEEIDWMRIGAALTDRGLLALRDGLKPGLTERQLGNLVERAYVADGGTNVIHYFAVTPMDAPTRSVPAQFPSTRRVARGDVVVTEIAAAFWDYPGQVLRSFTVAAEPPPLYRQLHATADAATPAQVIAAAGIIEDTGFTTCDDLLHGYGGGYLPPILGSASRPAGPVPEEPFRAGMTVVIQPNVITKDGRAGVQTGEMVLVTRDGVERLHGVPRGFVQV